MSELQAPAIAQGSNWSGSRTSTESIQDRVVAIRMTWRLRLVHITTHFRKRVRSPTTHIMLWRPWGAFGIATGSLKDW